jgi:hypothetical protein
MPSEFAWWLGWEDCPMPVTAAKSSPIAKKIDLTMIGIFASPWPLIGWTFRETSSSRERALAQQITFIFVEASFQPKQQPVIAVRSA